MDRQKEAADRRAHSTAQAAKDNVLLAAAALAGVTCKIAILEILMERREIPRDRNIDRPAAKDFRLRTNGRDAAASSENSMIRFVRLSHRATQVIPALFVEKVAGIVSGFSRFQIRE